jgi:hypothetical protein
MKLICPIYALTQTRKGVDTRSKCTERDKELRIIRILRAVVSHPHKSTMRKSETWVNLILELFYYSFSHRSYVARTRTQGMPLRVVVDFTHLRRRTRLQRPCLFCRPSELENRGSHFERRRRYSKKKMQNAFDPLTGGR